MRIFKRVQMESRERAGRRTSAYPFNPEVFAKEEAKMKLKKLARLQSMATDLNYQLIPNQ